MMAWVDAQNGFVAAGLAIARTTNGGKSWTMETLPTDAEFTKPSLIVQCFEYPGPAAYIGVANGTVRLLKNDTAGGNRADRYSGSTQPTSDAGMGKDAKVGSDSATTSSDAAIPTGDSSQTPSPSSPSPSGGGGCSLSGESPTPETPSLSCSALLVLLFTTALLFCSARRRW
jgi:hypothetical protein